MNAFFKIVASQCTKRNHIVHSVKKNTENIDPKISSASNGKAMILPNCAICDSKKSRFTKHQEAKGLLSINIGWYFILNAHKMNEIVFSF